MYHHPDSGRNPVSTSPPTASNNRSKAKEYLQELRAVAKETGFLVNLSVGTKYCHKKPDF